MPEAMRGASAGARVGMNDWPYPRLIAHRGAGRCAPENTLAALRHGASLGYRMFEFDVTLSADGRPVLMHDASLERTTNGCGPVACATWAELSVLDVGAWHSPRFAGEPVPSLMAVARWLIANGLAANIEIKPAVGRERETGALVAALAAYAWRAAGPALAPPLLSSFSLEALEGARDAAPELPRACLAERPGPDLSARLKRVNAVAAVVSHEALDAAQVRDLHDQGYRVLSYTVNDPGKVAQMLAWGLDGAITDSVDLITPPG